MSIRNSSLVVSVCDAMTGKILGTYDLNTFDNNTMYDIIDCLFDRYVLMDQHGLLIKVGSNDI